MPPPPEPPGVLGYCLWSKELRDQTHDQDGHSDAHTGAPEPETSLSHYQALTHTCQPYFRGGSPQSGATWVLSHHTWLLDSMSGGDRRIFPSKRSLLLEPLGADPRAPHPSGWGPLCYFTAVQCHQDQDESGRGRGEDRGGRCGHGPCLPVITKAAGCRQ